MISDKSLRYYISMLQYVWKVIEQYGIIAKEDQSRAKPGKLDGPFSAIQCL
jgi:hypothetical protein